MGAGAGLLIAALPVRLAAGDPPWLDLALGVPSGRVLWARAICALLYAQGAVLPAVFALALRHGLGAALPVFGAVEALAALGSALGALAASRPGPRGAWLYLPAAVLLWALCVNALSSVSAP